MRARARRRWWRREDLGTEGFSGGRAEGRRPGGEGRRAAAARGGSSRAASREWAPAGPEWVYTSMELRLRHNRASTSFPYPSIIHADLSPPALSVLSREPAHLLAPIAERRAPFLEEFLFSWFCTLFLPSSGIPRLFFVAVRCAVLFRFGVSARRGSNHRRFMRENSSAEDTASVPFALPLCPSTGLLFRRPIPIFPLLSYSLNLWPPVPPSCSPPLLSFSFFRSLALPCTLSPFNAVHPHRPFRSLSSEPLSASWLSLPFRPSWS